MGLVGWRPLGANSTDEIPRSVAWRSRRADSALPFWTQFAGQFPLTWGQSSSSVWTYNLLDKPHPFYGGQSAYSESTKINVSFIQKYPPSWNIKFKKWMCRQHIGGSSAKMGCKRTSSSYPWKSTHLGTQVKPSKLIGYNKWKNCGMKQWRSAQILNQHFIKYFEDYETSLIIAFEKQ